MGDSKRSVKNKARVEGSITAFYLHRETTQFCSHYFKSFTLATRNVRNNMEFVDESRPITLSLFNKPGRPTGKKCNHWLTAAEWMSAHVHILINSPEVKPYLEYIS